MRPVGVCAIAWVFPGWLAAPRALILVPRCGRLGVYTNLKLLLLRCSALHLEWATPYMLDFGLPEGGAARTGNPAHLGRLSVGLGLHPLVLDLVGCF